MERDCFQPSVRGATLPRRGRKSDGGGWRPSLNARCSSWDTGEGEQARQVSRKFGGEMGGAP